MLERFEEIEAFADIGDFMDHPVKTYSSGMKSRLGFAVAVNVDPDILVIDEALSAGDAAFKKRALQRMYDLRDSRPRSSSSRTAWAWSTGSARTPCCCTGDT